MESAIARLLLGDSAAIEAVRARVHKVARAPLPVLIQGPTGVGKELVARALHLASGRRGPIVATNVCAIAESMFESTLFGHVRGAFTGALSDHPGHLVEADGGTLFLDEIGGLSLAQQMTLLRAVEIREFRPIGARSDRRSNFRLVCATNESVDDLIETGRFRRDFVRRIRAVTIDVPPLRERRGDVAMLARHFLRGACDDASLGLGLSSEAMDLLLDHDWPDNVRELKQVIECSVLLHEGGAIVGRDTVAQVLLQATRYESSGADGEHRRQLTETLERHAWRIGAVAAELGVHRTTLFRRMRRLRIDAPHALARRSAVRNGEPSQCDDLPSRSAAGPIAEPATYSPVPRPRRVG